MTRTSVLVPLVLAACVGVASVARADDEMPVAKLKVAADAMFVFPVDKYADDADAGFGGFGRIERRLGDKMWVTGRAGGLFHATDLDGASLVMLMAHAGLRYDLDATRENGPFFHVLIGVNHVRLSVDAMGVSLNDSSTSLSFDWGGGFQAGPVQFRGSVLYTSSVTASVGGDRTNYIGLALTLGYDFVAR